MILDRLVKFFTSLRLTVVLLVLGLVLVFWGTIAQVHLGLYKAQNDFFRSFFVFWEPKGSSLRIPIFPGGYMIGGLLIINLIAAHFRYYKPGKRKIGIIMIHLGLVLLLIGQLLTDFLATESIMHLRNGETRNYSESQGSYELAITDKSDPKADKVVAVPVHRLAAGGDVSLPNLPFTVRVKTYYPNSSLLEKPESGYQPVQVTAGIGSGVWWKELPRETVMDRRDMPSAIVEILSPKGSLGSYLVSSFLAHPQPLEFDGQQYDIALRLERFYKPYNMQLIEFRHDKYPGTEIPKNFSSRVRLIQPGTGEDREVLIRMNAPLRYKGDTYYQSSFDPDNQGSVLQVVRNPSWLTPYFACLIVGAGLTVQFLSHLVGFATKRRTK
ncbi:MAG TPA: cytochrome c biogenesis protein ResB [Candidatus Paceibacterota bacterium]|nr:cytochrome c biogenesis protein ResB [Candidatus Paceibacterota bacterium]